MLVGIGLIAIVLLLGGSLIGWLAWERATQPTLDEATLCPIRGPNGVTAVLIDTTDAFSPIQEHAMRNELERLRDSLSPHELIEIYLVGPTTSAPLERVWGMCRPADDPREVRQWTRNPQRVARRWQDGFEEPMRRAIEHAARAEPAATSPILESIKSVAVTAFRPADRAASQHRLVLVSDLLEHSDCFSNYRDALDLDRISRLPCFVLVRPDLRGVTVEVLYINRTTRRPIQGVEHIRFWEQLVRLAGGEIKRIYRF
jgi:hypothetical protein